MFLLRDDRWPVARLIPLLLLLILCACGASPGVATSAPEASEITSEPNTTPTEVQSTQATPSTEPELDPECEAAFLAGLEARDAEPVTYLDPALFACETIAQFSATSRAYPDAIDIPLAAFFSNRCQAIEENLATPLCSEVNPHD